MTQPHPDLRGRNLDGLVADIAARLPGYTPEWRPGGTGPGAVLVQALAHDLRVLGERINQAPLKNEMSFLDMLGLDTIAAQGARAPVVFQPRPRVSDGRVPAGSQVGAAVAGGQVVFETEQAIALAAARLTDVVTLWPGRDAYADHGPQVRQGEPVRLFDPLVPVPHELYLGDEVELALAGAVTVEVQFDLAKPGSAPVELAWEYWDGDAWRGFAAPGSADTPGMSFDGTAGLTRSGTVRLVADCAEAKPATVNGITSYWLRARTTRPLPPSEATLPAQIGQVRLRTSVRKTGVPPDSSCSDQLKLDLTKAFAPFGPTPATGACWYLSSEEAFGKPGATVHLGGTSVTVATGDPNHPTRTLEVAAELWDGESWLGLSSSPAVDFVRNGGRAGTSGGDTRLWVTLPTRVGRTTVNGQEARWLRLRITNGAFVHIDQVTITGADGKPVPVDVTRYVPPLLDDVTLDYEYSPAGQRLPAICLTRNDFQWADHSARLQSAGQSFAAFTPVADRTPTLYLGFDAPLPADLVGLYFGLDTAPADDGGPELRWEYWDGTAWSPVAVTDETAGLTRSGMVGVRWPGIPPVPSAGVLLASDTTVQLTGPPQVRPFRAGDRVFVQRDGTGELATVAASAGLTVTLARALSTRYTQASLALADLPRFGVPRTWLRARLGTDGEPGQPDVSGLYVNAVWAVQSRTITDELLGSGTGQPGQVCFTRESPVLAGEVIEVRELDGSGAGVELPLLLADLARVGLSEADTRQVTDPVSGKLTEVWVRWRQRPNLFFSGPDDRHYLIERTRGRVLFGDGTHGRMPPPGAANVVARRYASGGGQAGNVPAGAITDLISGVLAQGVTNPRDAEGGADAQPADDVVRTGPDATRHRRQAVSAADYEALAREASPAVALAKALPATHPSGRPQPGWVGVVVVPHSPGPRPVLTHELRRQVSDFLAARAPAPVSARIAVLDPVYLPIGIDATVVPAAGADAHEAAIAALTRFLHPVTGGPGGRGWAFGRDVYLSDVAAVLGRLSEVDSVPRLGLVVAGSPAGDTVAVPADRIVAAGDLRVTLAGEES